MDRPNLSAMLVGVGFLLVPGGDRLLVRGDEVTWVDATTDRTAHVAMDVGSPAGIPMVVTKDGALRAKFTKSGTYEDAATSVPAAPFIPTRCGGRSS
jgi:hypothetical protein